MPIFITDCMSIVFSVTLVIFPCFTKNEGKISIRDFLYLFCSFVREFNHVIFLMI